MFKYARRMGILLSVKLVIKMKKVYLDNRLPLYIKIGVYYTEDDEGYITAIDEDSMRQEFERKLERLKELERDKDAEY